MRSFLYSLNLNPVNSTEKSKKKNKTITLQELAKLLQDPRAIPAVYNELPKLARQAVMNIAGASTSLDKAKAKIGYFIPAGTRDYGHGHLDGKLQLNGTVQVDIDMKHPSGADLAILLLKAIQAAPPEGCLFACLSPSTYGIKLMFLVDVDGGLTTDNYQAVNRQLNKELADYLDPYGAKQSFVKFDELAPSKTMYLPFNRAGRPGVKIWPDATARTVVPQQQVVQDPVLLDVQYTGSEVSKAAMYLMDNGIDTAEGHSQYRVMCFVCAKAFGAEEGRQYAYQILLNSTCFQRSDFKKNFARNWKQVLKDLQAGKAPRAGAGYIMALAKKAGYRPNYTPEGITNKLKAGEHLSDALKRIGMDPADLYGADLIAGTGSGKTTLLAGMASQANMTVLSVPTVLAVQNAAKKTGAVPFYGGKETRQVSDDDSLIVTTIASLPALATRVDISKRHIVLDEFHTYSTDGDRSYRNKQLHQAWTIAKQGRSITTMTGTPVFNIMPELEGRQCYIFHSDEATKTRRKGTIVRAKDTIYAAAKLAEQSYKAGRWPHIVLNDKKDKRTLLGRYLQELLPDAHIKIDADAKDTPDYQSIVDGVIPKERSAIISTTVMREGNDIHEQRQVDTIFVGMYHASTLAQIPERYRKQTNAHLYIVKGKAGKKTPQFFDKRQQASRMVELARQHIEYIHRTEQQFSDLQILNIRNNLADLHIYVDDSGTPHVDYISINAKIAAMEVIHQYHSDPAIIAQLEAYGWTLAVVESDEEGSEEVKAAAKAESGLNEDQRKAKYQDDVQRILSSAMPDVTLRTMAGKLAGRVVELQKKYRISAAQAASCLQDAYSGKQYARLKRQLTKQYLHQNDAYMQSGADALKVDLAILEGFKPGERYTGDEVLAKVQAAVDAHQLKDAYLQAGEGRKVAQAVEMVRTFFEVKKTRLRINNGQRTVLYIIGDVVQHGGQKAVKQEPVDGGGAVSEQAHSVH